MRRMVEWGVTLALCVLAGVAVAWLAESKGTTVSDRPWPRTPAYDDAAPRQAWARVTAWAEGQARLRYLSRPGLTVEQLRRDEAAGVVTGITALEIAAVQERQRGRD